MEIRGRFMNEIKNGAARLWTPEFLSMSGSNFLLFISQYIMSGRETTMTAAKTA